MDLHNNSNSIPSKKKRMRWNICRSIICCQLHARLLNSDIKIAVLSNAVQFISFVSENLIIMSPDIPHTYIYTNWQQWRCLYFVYQQSRTLYNHSSTFRIVTNACYFTLFRTLTQSHRSKHFSSIDDISAVHQLAPTPNINIIIFVAATQYPVYSRVNKFI